MMISASYIIFLWAFLLGLAMFITNIVISFDLNKLGSFVYENRWLISITMMFVSLMVLIYIK